MEEGGEGSRGTRSNAYERPEHLVQIERTEQGQSRYNRIVKGRNNKRIVKGSKGISWKIQVIKKGKRSRVAEEYNGKGMN